MMAIWNCDYRSLKTGDYRFSGRHPTTAEICGSLHDVMWHDVLQPLFSSHAGFRPLPVGHIKKRKAVAPSSFFKKQIVLFFNLYLSPNSTLPSLNALIFLGVSVFASFKKSRVTSMRPPAKMVSFTCRVLSAASFRRSWSETDICD